MSLDNPKQRSTENFRKLYFLNGKTLRDQSGISPLCETLRGLLKNVGRDFLEMFLREKSRGICFLASVSLRVIVWDVGSTMTCWKSRKRVNLWVGIYELSYASVEGRCSLIKGPWIFLGNVSAVTIDGREFVGLVVCMFKAANRFVETVKRRYIRTKQNVN